MTDGKSSAEKEKKTSLFNRWKEKSPEVKTAVYRNTALAEGLIAAVLLILAFIFSFETDAGYFKTGSFFVSAAGALLVISAIWIFTAAFTLKDPSLPKEISVRTNSAYFASSFAGFMSFFEAAYRTYSLVSDKDLLECFDKSLTNYSELRISRISVIVDIVTVAVCLFAAVYFFGASGEKHRSPRMVILGIAPATRAIVGVFQIYFNVEIGMNSPVKLICEIGLMTAVLAFLAEDRMRVSEDYAKPNLYIAANLLCTAVAGAVGISVIFFYFYYNKDLTSLESDAGYGEMCIEGAFCLICAACSFTHVSSYIKYIGKPLPEEKASEPAEGEEPACDTPAENAEDCAAEEKQDVQSEDGPEPEDKDSES